MQAPIHSLEIDLLTESTAGIIFVKCRDNYFLKANYVETNNHFNYYM